MNALIEQKKYGIAILADTAAEFEEFLNHTVVFSDNKNVQTIVLDRAQDADKEKIKLLSSENGMEYVRLDENVSSAEAYNKALDFINVKFICFSDANIYYDENAIDAIEQALYELPMHKIAMLNYRKYNEDSILNDENKTTKFILNDRQNIFLFPYSYFISTELIEETRFKNVCEEESLLYFLLEILLKVDSVAFAEKSYANYTEKRKCHPEDFYGCRNKDFYIPSLKENLLPFLKEQKEKEGHIKPWLQRTVVHLLYFKIFSNFNRRDRFVLVDDEIDEFFDAIADVLKYVEDETLIRRTHYRQFFVPLPVISMLAYLKHGKNIKNLNRKFYLEKGTLYFEQAGKTISLRNEQRIVVRAINVKENSVDIDAYFHTDMLFAFASNSIVAYLNEEKIDICHNDIYSYDKCFGRAIDKKYTFTLKLDKESFIRDGASLEFFVELGPKKQKLSIVFMSQASRLRENYRNSYWQIGPGFILQYSDMALKVTEVDDDELLKIEKAYVDEMVFKEDDPDTKEEIKKIREAYFAEREKLEKMNIRLYYDKLYKAGDNAEYQFRHDVKLQEQEAVNCYYIINEDAPEYPGLKKKYNENILEYGSDKLKLYALCAQAIIATGQDIMEFSGFSNYSKHHFKDLFNAKLICISHGVTIQKNADVQNRLYDNTMFYTTSSKYEVEHIKAPVYGYEDEQIALTGMARYDGLKKKRKRIILICPTWRNNLVGEREDRNSRRNYFTPFKESDYFKIFNKMINDEKLIKAAKKGRYKIIFLVHPLMSAQIDDYDKNEYVEIVQAEGENDYEKLLRKARLMVTDYSGVHYDFAYMKKPVIYYQPKEIPARFTEGGMKFKTMGFGPVTDDYDEAINLICEYIKKGCKPEQKYIDRIKDFFEFDDFKNCDRIHEAINQWLG